MSGKFPTYIINYYSIQRKITPIEN